MQDFSSVFLVLPDNELQTQLFQGSTQRGRLVENPICVLSESYRQPVLTLMQVLDSDIRQWTKLLITFYSIINYQMRVNHGRRNVSMAENLRQQRKLPTKS